MIRSTRCLKDDGFTLLELLIVIAIFAFLCLLALPGYQKVVNTSRSAACQGNLRSIWVGMNGYAVEHDNWMPPHLATYTNPGGGKIYPKWYAWIAPYLAQDEGKDYVNTSMNKIFHCPANPYPYDPDFTYYSPTGKSDYSYGYNSRFLSSNTDTVFTNQPPMRRTSVPRPSLLVLVSDIPNENPEGGGRAEAGLLQLKPNWFHPSATTISTRHNGGSNLLFLDGHIEFRKGNDILGSNYNGMNWTPYAQ